MVPWGTRIPERLGTVGLPGSCGPQGGGRLPRLAEPHIYGLEPGRVSTSMPKVEWVS